MLRRIRLSLLLLAALSCSRGAPPPERIVLVVVDTLRRDHVGAYGGSVETPHIDRLAEAGTVYRNAVSSFHATSMSMGALFTGHTPSIESGRADAVLVWNAENWCGLARLARAEESKCVPDALRSLGEALSEAGYWTLGVTPHPLTHRPFGFDAGFDRWIEIKPGRKAMMVFNEQTRPRYAKLRAGARVNRTVMEALDERPSDRFFLYVHYLDAHDWYLTGVPYAEAVEAADAAVGELLDGLAARGLLHGTAIVLTSDHGEALEESHFQPAGERHAGNPAFEPVLRVPLIVSGAQPRVPPDAFVRSEDAFRLLLDLAGSASGRGSELRPDELFVTERVYRTYREGRWKSFWLRGSNEARLVDLAADPGEQRDLSAEHPEVLERHRSRIRELSTKLGAPDASEADTLPDHLERLRVLGYLEPAYQVD